MRVKSRSKLTPLIAPLALRDLLDRPAVRRDTEDDEWRRRPRR